MSEEENPAFIYYSQLCEDIDKKISNGELAPHEGVSVFAGLVWYLCPAAGHNARSVSKVIKNLFLKWEEKENNEQ